MTGKRSRDNKSKVAKQETLEECKERFLETLDRVGETARFCTTGAADFVPPGLGVEGFGEVSFPLRESDAPSLIAVADQAPYGRGEETILDTKIRRVWQIGAEGLSFKNPAWDGFLEAIVGDVQRELGLSSKIRGQLYKLLIYDQGSFFVPHRDTEKEERMFVSKTSNLSRGSCAKISPGITRVPRGGGRPSLDR